MSFGPHATHVSLIVVRQTDAVSTWDMFQSWTQIDFRTLVGSNINSPANAMYVTKEEHNRFGHFDIYLDKESASLIRGDLSLGLIIFSTRIIPTSTKYAYPENSGV